MSDCTCGCHPALENCGKCCDKWKYTDKNLLEKVSLQRQIFDLNDKIKKLESFKEMFIKEKIEDLIRLKKLEDKVDKLTDEFEKHRMEYEIYRNKYFCTALSKPYKCPVCEGNCMRPNPLKGIENMQMPVNLDCIVCGGKGLVWR